uniref:AMP-dependent synthetase and ligase n=1 Tax=Solibacter usitatus (strain Ellin6076) TaxID=234267 RepID=Q029D5_SOLUE
MFLQDASIPESNLALFDAAQARWYSYGELWSEVARTAESLKGPKALAFCFCRNNIASVVWYLAAVEAGHSVALLDDGLTPEFKTRLIELYDPELIQEAGQHEWRRTNAAGGTIASELAVLLSTSGSTGSPKFVRLTAENVSANARSISEALAIGAADRAISSLPMHYSYGLSVLNTHLLRGASMVLTNDGLMSPNFWKLFREQECTSFAGVPYSYQMLRRLGIDGLNVPSLRTMTQAGGKLHTDLVAHFHEKMVERGGRFFVMYGQTEATARIAILPHDRLPEKLGSAGVAIPGGRFHIESDGRESGELIYTGPNVMMGYATCREDLALGDVLQGRLATGDLARLDSEGFVTIEGRMKRDAKLFGLRINLDEIESMLRAHGPTAVISGPDKLLIYCEHGDEAAFARYRTDLAAKLKVNHRALEFFRLERLPVNGSGKIDYQALAGAR